MRRKVHLWAQALIFVAVSGLLGAAHSQNQEQHSPAAEKLGPVDQEEAKPSKAAVPVNNVVDPGVIPSRQAITPAGFQTVFESRVNGVVFGDNGDSIYAATLGQKGSLLYQISLKTNQMLGVVSSSVSAGMQGLAYDPVNRMPLMSGLSGGAKGKNTVVQLVAPGGLENPVADQLGTFQAGGLSLGYGKNSQGRRLAAVALTFNDEAAIIDLQSNQVVAKIRTGIAPFTTLVNHDSSAAYVSNWGGRFPAAGEPSAATGPEPNADQVLIDERGIASSGTVSKIDLVSGKVTATIAVGLHPTGLALDEGRRRLFVANSNSDTISVADTATNRVLDTLELQPFSKKVAGISPESVTLAPDHATLYVACAGINAVGVVDVKGPHPHLIGVIPTGWYPDDIAVSPDGKYIAVSTLLGVGSGWNSPNLLKREKRDGIKPELNDHRRYVHADRGTVHIIPVPDQDELERYSIAVAEDNHVELADELGAAGAQHPANRHAAPRCPFRLI